ncbi:transporter substrate-binding domain-containing protein [Rhodobacterales bacterium HKCCSP123]|nr:transporter substrate-binding domain-containing protein [Rhodobacterales bacterium HKCCSP123]
MTGDLAGLAANGVLKVAINTGNRALVQERDGVLDGVSPALARRLADEIGARFEPVIYTGAGKVFADAGTGAWDVGFLAIDPERATRVSFTRPYHKIEATYAVRADSAISEPEEADQVGLTVLTSRGSAYQLYLSNALRNARLEIDGTPPESFAAFRSGRGDVVAGVRESLERAFGGDPAFRVLTAPLASVEQAMVLPGPDAPLAAALDRFVARALESGFVAEALGNG